MDEQPVTPQPTTSMPPSPAAPVKKFSKKLLLIIVLVVAVAAGAIIYWLGGRNENSSGANVPATSEAAATQTSQTATTSTLDLTKLPLGDKRYSTSAKKGYVYSCQTSFNGGGAFTQGPWINSAGGTWDLTKKAEVDGSVTWSNAQWSVSDSGTTRTLTGNGLPKHRTGTYPIASSDDAYSYDRNPNSIKTQTLSFSLPANPSQLSSPQCVGGEVGIMLSGIPIFNAFDAGGRDAVANEVQDACDGHPQVSGMYHYHGYSDCLEDTAVTGQHSALVGYAFDGFGIYGLRGENGQELSSNDLDECHGHSHSVTWDGKTTTIYHYHLTHDFPYSVSCFRGQKAVNGPLTQGGQMPPRPAN